MDLDLEHVPPLSACDPGLRPLEYNVALALIETPDKIGSIIKPDAYKDKEDMALQVGRIIAMSQLAFNYDKGLHEDDLPVIGDIVMIVRYGGGEFTGRDGRRYRMVKDKDIMGVVLTDHLTEEEGGPVDFDAAFAPLAAERTLPAEFDQAAPHGVPASKARNPLAPGGDPALQPLQPGRVMPGGEE